MEISFSYAARERAFAKAMRRIGPVFDPLLDEVSATELPHPTPKAILVGFTDDKLEDFFEEVPNNDGYFQVLTGCTMGETDAALIQQVFEKLRRAVRDCPLAEPDHQALEEVFQRIEPTIVK